MNDENHFDNGNQSSDEIAAPKPAYLDEPKAVAESATNGSIPEETWNRAVAAWVNNHVRNSPISGASEAWNHLHAVIPRLREFLEKEMGQGN